ncbi:F0F1 ATP synthase subunit A [Lacticaseibacillus chiayiensis]|uniref:ATP synthase subunit a n=1 Tax=Lacticaseibacillus chiayiensis TaxID=2100821 RepID=A0A4Q1TRB6_9LACO|nr:F0F1 ATP synthase subunit A [Lacticaseibacillus chiayiensis]QVI35646.1 F0F1 ATP synthase subunit A [Lacticaseibacillus chiayiensis]RXT20645.1 F0F1 ATP synthase subunit A [Lacticaseibacillus chiayiensis]RXT58308.1 F0F1 ATP synthase subunit A [Lacticaseibacillus chiayiensis]UYN57480.1 F0F1 ATP synthase subunit A [Lacticaseibacillus chiayiensis]
MNEKYPQFTFYGLDFNLTNDLGVLVSAILVFLLVFWLSRNLKMRPGGKQNVLEWIMDFTNGIVKSAIPGSERYTFNLFAFTLFLFIFIANQLGLFIELDIGKDTWFRSPTASPVITMTLALAVLVLSHYFGVVFRGFKGYLKGYASPLPLLLPINLLEEFTNFITLSLRLYGNIFAGEVLVLLIRQWAFSGGAINFVSATVAEIAWQGFSVFIGSIQAYVFVTLGMVYTSNKVLPE